MVWIQLILTLLPLLLKLLGWMQSKQASDLSSAQKEALGRLRSRLTDLHAQFDRLQIQAISDKESLNEEI